MVPYLYAVRVPQLRRPQVRLEAEPVGLEVGGVGLHQRGECGSGGIERLSEVLHEEGKRTSMRCRSNKKALRLLGYLTYT